MNTESNRQTAPTIATDQSVLLHVSSRLIIRLFDYPLVWLSPCLIILLFDYPLVWLSSRLIWVAHPLPPPPPISPPTLHNPSHVFAISLLARHLFQWIEEPMPLRATWPQTTYWVSVSLLVSRRATDYLLGICFAPRWATGPQTTYWVPDPPPVAHLTSEYLLGICWLNGRHWLTDFSFHVLGPRIGDSYLLNGVPSSLPVRREWTTLCTLHHRRLQVGCRSLWQQSGSPSTGLLTTIVYMASLSSKCEFGSGYQC